MQLKLFQTSSYTTVAVFIVCNSIKSLSICLSPAILRISLPSLKCLINSLMRYDTLAIRSIAPEQRVAFWTLDVSSPPNTCLILNQKRI